MLLFASLALAGDCSMTTVGEVTQIRAPAVLVLGERRGTAPDLPRAVRIVKELQTKARVTLAMDQIDSHSQSALNQKAPDLTTFQVEIGWSNGFEFSSYEDLFTIPGVHLAAIGVPWEPKPDDEQILVPPGYFNLLSETMGASPVPGPLESATASFVAWRDYRMAQRALSEWSGEGYLVILADRFHVQGAKGVGWQLARLQKAPVTHVILSKSNSPCYAGELTLP